MKPGEINPDSPRALLGNLTVVNADVFNIKLFPSYAKPLRNSFLKEKKDIDIISFHISFTIAMTDLSI